MKESTTKHSLIPKFYCNVFGHNFKVSKKVTYHINEFKCQNCRIEYTTNSKGNLIELTPKYKEINSVLERIHNRKKSKLVSKIVSITNYRMTS